MEVTDCLAVALESPTHRRMAMIEAVASISFAPAASRTRYTPTCGYTARAGRGTRADGRGCRAGVTERPHISEIAWLLAASDLIRFQYEPFHNKLFQQLLFMATEAEQTRVGLDVRTLEMPPGTGWLLWQITTMEQDV